MTVDGKPRKVLLHPDRNGYLYVVDRTNGEILSADPYGFVNSTKGVDLKTGPADHQSGEGDQAGHRGARHLSDRLGRQGLEPVRLLAAHRPDVHPARKPVHGLGERAGELHRRHALCRRQRRHEGRARRQPRRVHRLGSGARRRPPGRSRKTCRSGAAPWPPPATWSSTEPWTAGSRRSMRAAAN